MVKAYALGLTPRSIIEQMEVIQIIDVHIPTIDGRELKMSRYTRCDKTQQLLLTRLKINLPNQPEAINNAFPQTEVQICIVHMIRNSLKYVGSKYQKEFIADLKAVYKAPSEENASYELEKLFDKWGQKYPLAVNPWKNSWVHVSTFFKYPEYVRKIIYTTNALEGLHLQLRKVTKNRTVFPNDEALTKILYLAIQDVMKKWSMPLSNWALTISQLAVMYEGRFS